jgi:hypothetical protein
MSGDIITLYEYTGSRLEFWDFSVDGGPAFEASLPDPGNMKDWAISGRCGFLADNFQLCIYDLGNVLRVAHPLIPPPSSFILLSAYPNPFNTSTAIRFTLPKPGQVSLEVYDPFGRRIRELIPTQRFQAGAQTLTWDANALPSGCYLLNLQGNGWSSAISAIKTK